MNKALMGLGPYTPPMKPPESLFLIANDWDKSDKGCWLTAGELEHIKGERPNTKVLCERYLLPDGSGYGYRIPNDVAETIFAKARQPGFTFNHYPWMNDFFESKLGEPYIERVDENDYRRKMNANFAEAYGGQVRRSAILDLDAERAFQAAWDYDPFPKFPPVLNKRDYYTRYIAGEFGNRLKVWDNLDAWQNSGFTGPIGIRNRKPDSPFCKYDIPYRLVLPVVQEFLAKGCPAADMTFNEAAPDYDLILQGEFMRLPSGLELTYSTVKRQMRIALKERCQYASRSAAVAILKHVMDTASYEWCEYLLDAYPDHAIEFSTYRRKLGSLNRNTLIWEVRKY